MSMSMFTIGPALDAARRENHSAFPDAPVLQAAPSRRPRRVASDALLALARASLALARRLDATRPMPVIQPASR